MHDKLQKRQFLLDTDNFISIHRLRRIIPKYEEIRRIKYWEMFPVPYSQSTLRNSVAFTSYHDMEITFTRVLATDFIQLQFNGLSK